MAEHRYTLERPKNRAKVIEMVLGGHSDAEVGAALKVTRQAVTQFRKRHADEIAPAIAQVEAAIIDVALKDKEARIRELAWLYGLARDEASEYGVTITETHYEGRGETRDEYVTRDFRTGMVKEMRGLLADIADEMGQRGGEDKANTDRTFVLIRERIIEHGQHLEPLG